MYALKQEGKEKVILLENVSVISLDPEKSKKNEYRVRFNYMSPIRITGRWTPDYHYFEYGTLEEAREAFEKICELAHIKLNFFISENPLNLEIVNKKSITSITYIEHPLRIIFNLNYSITSYDRNNNPIEISKFVFWDYDKVDTLENDKLEINSTLTHLIEV